MKLQVLFKLLTGELKRLFWSLVIPNIENYQLLDDDMKYFYDSRNLFLETNENFANTLKSNEPKGGGKDYILLHSPEAKGAGDNELDESEEETMHQELISRLKDAFDEPRNYKNKFELDSDSDMDENCLKILDRKENIIEELDDETEKLISTFNLLVRTEGEIEDNVKLSNQEIMLRLENPDVMNSPAHVAKLTKAVKVCLSVIDFFKDQLSEATQEDIHSDQENVAPDSDSEQISSLEVPSMNTRSQEDFTPLVDSRNVRQSSRTPSLLLSQRITRSANQLVEQRKMNPRMKYFVESLKKPRSGKRRRSSTSPQ